MSILNDSTIFGDLNVEGSLLVNSVDVVEYNLNSNGEYIRFVDGTQICSYSAVVTNQAINSAYGTLYQGTRTMTFPAEFSEAPSGVCGSFKVSGQGSWATLTSISSTNIGLRGLDVASRASGLSVTISYIAIGRWF